MCISGTGTSFWGTHIASSCSDLCGTLAEVVTYGTGDLPIPVAMGDLDGGLHQVLVVANFIDDNVSVLLNQCPPASAARAAAVGGAHRR